MLWVLLTVAAAPLQVARNVMVALVLSFVTMMSVLSVPMMISGQSPTMLTVAMAWRINSFGDYGTANALGLIACLAVALLYLAIVARVLIKLLDEENSFAILAAAGLVIQFGLQALINMAVNVQIAPSKGMTLPFISYGGSSMLALSIAMGLLLAFTRRNPYLTRSPYVVKWGGESIG